MDLPIGLLLLGLVRSHAIKADVIACMIWCVEHFLIRINEGQEIELFLKNLPLLWSSFEILDRSIDLPLFVWPLFNFLCLILIIIFLSLLSHLDSLSDLVVDMTLTKLPPLRLHTTNLAFSCRIFFEKIFQVFRRARWLSHSLAKDWHWLSNLISWSWSYKWSLISN